MSKKNKVVPFNIETDNPIDYYNEHFTEHAISSFLDLKPMRRVGVDATAYVLNNGDESERMFVFSKGFMTVKKLNGLALNVGEKYSCFNVLRIFKFDKNFMRTLNYVLYELLNVKPDYIRVGVKYFRIITKIDRYGISRTENKPWDKMTLLDDYDKDFLTKIPKYKDFTIEPDNKGFRESKDGNYNLYSPFAHKPDKEFKGMEAIKWSEILMQHIFGEQYDIGLKYLKVLYDLPRQALPILVLTSEERQTGKLQPYTEPILTPKGWDIMGNINVGSEVIDPVSGLPIKVLKTFKGTDLDIYKVTFNDGTFTECCNDHLFKVQTIKDQATNSWRVVDVNYMLERGLLKKHNNTAKFRVPLTNAIEFNKQDTSLHPRLLGMLLGDGFLGNNVYFSSHSDDAEYNFELIKSLVPKDVNVILDKQYGDVKARRIRLSSHIKPYLKELGILGLKSRDKFIPKNYIYNSVKIRKELLSGLMDTDGSCQNHKTFKITRYSTMSEQLKDDFVEVIRSLGGIANSTSEKRDKYNGGVCWNVSLRVPFNPFKLKNKSDNFNSVDYKFHFNKTIRSIDFLRKDEGQCILVDSKNHLYVTRDYIVTHNTTFVDWINIIFGANAVVINPQDIGSSFNASYSDKNVIIIEESRFENVQATEKLKNLSTQKKILTNTKHVAEYSIPFYGKIIITSNDENKFSKVDNPEIRYWVRKIPTLTGKSNHSILDDLVNEIPQFIAYLNTLPDIDTTKSRMVFEAEELTTEALQTVKDESKPELQKEIEMVLDTFCMENYKYQEFKFCATDIKDKWFKNNNQISLSYINKILKQHMKLVNKADKAQRYIPFETNEIVPTKRVGKPYTIQNEHFNIELEQEKEVEPDTPF